MVKEKIQICEQCGYKDTSGIEMEQTHDGVFLCDDCYHWYEMEYLR